MQRIKAIVSQVLGIDESLITNESSPETIPSWDSFNALMLVSELERAFSVSFTIEEVTSVKNVGDIQTRLAAHGVVLQDD